MELNHGPSPIFFYFFFFNETFPMTFHEKPKTKDHLPFKTAFLCENFAKTFCENEAPETKIILSF